MSEQDGFERIVERLHAATLDDSQWPGACALIDEVCSLVGNGLLVVDGEESRVHSAGFFYRGHRRQDLEREYLESYHPIDERVPRFRQLPFDRLARARDLYRDEELKTSPAYNEFLRPAGGGDGLNIRLRGVGGCEHISWVLRDPVARDGWGSSQLALIGRLRQHIRHFVGVRQVLTNADALGTSLNRLLSCMVLGVVQLDRRGRILELNDRAARILRTGDGLLDREGFLHAQFPEDNQRLGELLEDGLPVENAGAAGASMTVRRSVGSQPLVVYVTPTPAGQYDFGDSRAGAVVLVVEPGCRPRLDPKLIGEALGLTPTQSRVAVWLAEGRTVRKIARATGCKETSVYWHVRQICQRTGVTRQADLIRLVLSVPDWS